MTKPETKTPRPIPFRDAIIAQRLARKQRKKDEKLKKQQRKAESRTETTPPEVVERFTKKYRFLGNFYLAPTAYNDILFPSSEHAYLAAKFDDISTRKMIAAIEHPGEAKSFAHSIGLTRSDWEERKVEVMREVVHAKFDQNKDLKDRLLRTGNALLEEGNRHGDTFWGTVDGIGENMLGKILMEIREKFSGETELSKNKTG